MKKLFYDFFPLVLFFAAFKLYNIFVATGVLMAASAIQIGYLWLRYRKVENMHVMTFVLVLVFGGMTIFFHNVEFLKWKVSIVNWLFTLVFIGSEFFGKKNLIQHLMDKHIELPKPVWQKLNFAWAAFFTLVGIINIYVAFHMSMSAWVNFKVFGILGLTIAFVVLQSLYLMKHIKEESSNNG